jgi:hypothetical protein
VTRYYVLRDGRGPYALFRFVTDSAGHVSHEYLDAAGLWIPDNSLSRYTQGGDTGLEEISEAESISVRAALVGVVDDDDAAIRAILMQAEPGVATVISVYGYSSSNYEIAASSYHSSHPPTYAANTSGR